MISLTVCASTSTLDQKLKAGVSTHYSHVVTDAVNVADYNVDFTITFTGDNVSTLFGNEKDLKTPFATIVDIGWSPGYQRHITLYKEKLLPDYNKDFVHLIKRFNIAYQGRDNC